MLDFSDRTRTGISFLTSAADKLTQKFCLVFSACSIAASLTRDKDLLLLLAKFSFVHLSVGISILPIPPPDVLNWPES